MDAQHTPERTTSTPIGVGIVVLTLATALIHLQIGLPPAAQIQTLFLVDAAVYIALLAALFAPGPQVLVQTRPVTRVLLALWAVATIVAWLVTGLGRSPIGYADKLIEVVLFALLTVDVVRARRSAA